MQPWSQEEVHSVGSLEAKTQPQLGPPSGFIDVPSSSSSELSSDNESDVKNDVNDLTGVAFDDATQTDESQTDVQHQGRDHEDDHEDDDDDDMLAQRGPAVPVLAGPMKFSISSYKDRHGRDRPEPIKILDAPLETVMMPTMPVPMSPPPPLPPPPPTTSASTDEAVVEVRKLVPNFESRDAALKSPAKFEAILLPEKPVFIIPKSPRSTTTTPTPPPPMLPSKNELRKSAEMTDFRFPSPPPPLPTKSETVKRNFSSQTETVSVPAKPSLPVKPPKELLSNQVKN